MIWSTEGRPAKAALVLILTQLILTVVIAVYFAVVTNQQNLVLASQTISQTTASERLTEEVRRDVSAHGEASASRSCASTQLLAFIIRTSNQRAHELETGSYLTEEDKTLINGFVDSACRFVPVDG